MRLPIAFRLPHLPQPRPVQFAVFFYLSHVFCQGWIGSSETFLGLAVIATGIAVAKGYLRIPLHPLYFPLALYLVTSSVSALVSPNSWQSMLEVGEWFSFLVFPVALTLYRGVPELKDLYVRVFGVFGIFVSSYGLFQYFILGHTDLEHRITGTTAHVMTFSGILLPVSLLFIALTFSERRMFTTLVAMLSTFALVMTFTRGAWVGWLAGFATLVLLRAYRWTLLIVGALVLALVLSPLAVFGRFVSMFDLQQSSNLDRIRMAQAGIEMIRDHPLLGLGAANVKEVYPLYRPPDAPRFRIPHLHNNLIEIWAERGVLALFAYLLLIAMFLRVCQVHLRDRSEKRTFATAGIAIAVGLLFAGLFEFNFGDTEVLLTTLDVFALIVVVLEPEILSVEWNRPALCSDQYSERS